MLTYFRRTPGQSRIRRAVPFSPGRLIGGVLLCVIVWGSLGTARAQRESFLVGNMDSGGFAELSVQATLIDRQVGVLVGGAGGWILNRRLVLGPAVYGLVTDLPLKRVPVLGDRTPSLVLAYGGLIVEWIQRPNRRVHTALRLLVGAGGATYSEDGFETAYDDEDVFVVLEPGLSVEANLYYYCRVGASLRYRLAGGVGLEGLTDRTLSGPGLGLYVKLGGF